MNRPRNKCVGIGDSAKMHEEEEEEEDEFTLNILN
jgi:hypothetical protein